MHCLSTPAVINLLPINPPVRPSSVEQTPRQLALHLFQYSTSSPLLRGNAQPLTWMTPMTLSAATETPSFNSFLWEAEPATPYEASPLPSTIHPNSLERLMDLCMTMDGVVPPRTSYNSAHQGQRRAADTLRRAVRQGCRGGWRAAGQRGASGGASEAQAGRFRAQGGAVKGNGARCLWVCGIEKRRARALGGVSETQAGHFCAQGEAVKGHNVCGRADRWRGREERSIHKQDRSCTVHGPSQVCGTTMCSHEACCPAAPV
eukprot:363324-Chlamydomonas_euryale.AAC.2